MLAEMFYELLEKIWEEEEIPSEWKEGLLIKIPKKGDFGLGSNHRGTTLLSFPGKVRNRVILESLRGPDLSPAGSESWFQTTRVMYRPDHNTANYSGTVN